MAGVQWLSHFQLGKETTAGTSVPATRMLFPEGTGILDEDLSLSFDEDSNRGTKTNVTRATRMGDVVTLNYRTASSTGLAYDEWVYFGSALRGGQTGTGAGADKIWTFTPQMTSEGTPDSYTAEVGDATQSFTIEYVQPSGFEVSASRDAMTTGSITYFG